MDCFDGMRLLEDNSIDLVVTSPPFNLGVKYDVYNDKMGIRDYTNFIDHFTQELFRVLKEGGRVCIDVPMITKDWADNGKRYSADHLFQNSLDQCGLIFREKIVWNKKGVSNRSAWGSYKSPSCPWVVYPVDMILVYVKGNQKIMGEKDAITISKQQFKETSYGIWWVEVGNKKGSNHPATFPKEIPERLINMYSYKDAIVLDPFMGEGTTCIVANELERKYIGFEISENYFSDAKKNLGC